MSARLARSTAAASPLLRRAGPPAADGASLDETITVRDGDLVLVPRGYHVVGTAAGYDCYYLNVMAGHGREWRFTVDPDHAWLMDWDPSRPRETSPGGGGDTR
ncbi:MAG: 5-deoxy-glucuronate isomerase [Candidatus Limnocylindrales bacterium]|nr:5-deoxy-glucuronate isomerase [Candidatus Limnocylindrales bacterium]